MNIKQKVRIKTRQMNIDTFSNQNLFEFNTLFVIFIQIKMPILKDLKLEDITY